MEPYKNTEETDDKQDITAQGKTTGSVGRETWKKETETRNMSHNDTESAEEEGKRTEHHRRP
jgi:hypothetical protein